jgi:hypothetical protein
MGLADQSEIRTYGPSPDVKNTAVSDWPQVRTPDGFVLRRTGGYTIYEPALAVDDRFQRKVPIEMI